MKPIDEKLQIETTIRVKFNLLGGKIRLYFLFGRAYLDRLSTPRKLSRWSSQIIPFSRQVFFSELSLSVPKTCVFEILTNDLNLWVPQDLSESNKTARIACCRSLINLFNDKVLQYMASNYKFILYNR